VLLSFPTKQEIVTEKQTLSEALTSLKEAEAQRASFVATMEVLLTRRV
jgi:hypothetical protein